jgi:hypothetical protein
VQANARPTRIHGSPSTTLPGPCVERGRYEDDHGVRPTRAGGGVRTPEDRYLRVAPVSDVQRFGPWDVVAEGRPAARPALAPPAPGGRRRARSDRHRASPRTGIELATIQEDESTPCAVVSTRTAVVPFDDSDANREAAPDSQRRGSTAAGRGERAKPVSSPDGQTTGCRSHPATYQRRTRNPPGRRSSLTRFFDGKSTRQRILTLMHSAPGEPEYGQSLGGGMTPQARCGVSD